MRANYWFNLLYLLAGAFLAVVSRTFVPGDAGWIGFGVSTGIVLVAVANILLLKATSARLAHTAVVVVALWSLTAALVFVGTTLGWLVFADAVGLVAVAVAGLTLNEFGLETTAKKRFQLVAPTAEAPARQYEAA
jgi:hypothetical protein